MKVSNDLKDRLMKIYNEFYNTIIKIKNEEKIYLNE